MDVGSSSSVRKEQCPGGVGALLVSELLTRNVTTPKNFVGEDSAPTSSDSTTLYSRF